MTLDRNTVPKNAISNRCRVREGRRATRTPGKPVFRSIGMYGYPRCSGAGTAAGANLPAPRQPFLCRPTHAGDRHSSGSRSRPARRSGGRSEHVRVEFPLSSVSARTTAAARPKCRRGGTLIGYRVDDRPSAAAEWLPTERRRGSASPISTADARRPRRLRAAACR
jgi:hypothetical protein